MNKFLTAVLSVAFGALLFGGAAAYVPVAAAEEEKSPLAVAWDFEGDGQGGKITDKSGNGITGTVLKADLDFAFGSEEASEGWGYARWETFSEEIPVIYDEARGSDVFFTKGLYEISYDDVSFFNDFDDYSFAAWVKFADVPAPNVNPYVRSAWLFKADRKMPLDSYCGIGFDFGYAGQQTFYSPPGRANECIHTSDYALTESRWTYFAMTITDGMYRIYADGEPIAVVRSGKGSDDGVMYLDAGETPVRYAEDFDVITVGGGQQTGVQFGGNFRPANIYLDDVCFYDRGLTPEEVQEVAAGNYALQADAQAGGGQEPPAEEGGCNAAAGIAGGLSALPLTVGAAVALAAGRKKHD